jgi:ABC-type phosphate transport system substrate-binding protein
VKRTAALLVTVALSLSCGGGEGGSGSRTLIQNKGSDTLVNVAQAWAEAYSQLTPNVAVAVTGGGSGTGFSSLINGTVDIANASRGIRDSETSTPTTPWMQLRLRSWQQSTEREAPLRVGPTWGSQCRGVPAMRSCE